MTRRKFLQVWQVATGIIVSFISAPAVYFWRTDRSRATDIDDRWIDAGWIEDLPIDQWQKEMLLFQRQDRWASFERKELIYIYRSDQDIIVFSAICPHAACLIRKNDEGLVVLAIKVVSPVTALYFQGRPRAHWIVCIQKLRTDVFM